VLGLDFDEPESKELVLDELEVDELDSFSMGTAVQEGACRGVLPLMSEFLFSSRGFFRLVSSSILS
jgi:hypothetical protein